MKPKPVAEVIYLTWTHDNLLGQVSHQGLGEDKPGGGWCGGYLIPSLVLTSTACSDRAAEHLCDFRVNSAGSGTTCGNTQESREEEGAPEGGETRTDRQQQALRVP